MTMHRAIALPLAAILLALTLSAAAAQDSPPPDPVAAPPDPIPTGAVAAPPADALTSAPAGSFAVYLPLVVRPNPLFDLYPPVNRAWEEEFIRLLNEERARHGLRTVVEHPLLTLAARRHAYDLGINKVPRGDCGGGPSHIGTDGTWPWHRVRWAGYPGRYDGEAVACGTHEAQYALRYLLDSPPHRAFLLKPDMIEVGVGVHPIITDVDWMQGAHSTVVLAGVPNP